MTGSLTANMIDIVTRKDMRTFTWTFDGISVRLSFWTSVSTSNEYSFSYSFQLNENFGGVRTIYPQRPGRNDGNIYVGTIKNNILEGSLQRRFNQVSLGGVRWYMIWHETRSLPDDLIKHFACANRKLTKLFYFFNRLSSVILNNCGAWLYILTTSCSQLLVTIKRWLCGDVINCCGVIRFELLNIRERERLQTEKENHPCPKCCFLYLLHVLHWLLCFAVSVAVRMRISVFPSFRSGVGRWIDRRLPGYIERRERGHCDHR